MKKIWELEYVILMDGAVIFSGRHIIEAVGIKTAIDTMSEYMNGDLLRGRKVMFEIVSASEIRWGQ